MNLHSLRLFHEIAKWGSVTKAAAALRISQPAVTAQVKKLEKEQQVRLLEADGRGIKLTPLGFSVYQKSQQLFALEGEIEQLIAKEQAETAGLLRIAGNYLAIQFVLPKGLERFKEDFPTTHVQLATLNTADVLAALKSGDVELAVLGSGAERYAEVTRQKIYDDRLCFVVNSQNALAGRDYQLSELLAEPFVGRESASFTQQSLLALFATAGLKAPSFTLIYNNSRDALQAVKDGQGIHYCSYLMVADLIKKGQLAEVLVSDVKMEHGIYLCWLQEERLTREAKHFRKSLLTQLN